MKHLIRIFIFTVFFFSAGAIASNDRQIAGLGTISCGKWLEHREVKTKESNAVLASWVEGFLTGMNIQRIVLSNEKAISLPDRSAVLAYVDKMCRANPLEDVYKVSTALYLAELKK